MRKLLILIVALICSAAMFSQETKENEYKVKNNLVEVTMYHDNGQISQTGFLTLDGKLQGDWFSYDETGRKLTAAKYDKGSKVGKWFFWNDKSLKEVDYESNQIVNVVEWSNDKTVVTRD